MNTTEVLRAIIMASSAGTLVILFEVARHYRDKWLYVIPPVLIVLNLALFSAARIVAGQPLPPDLVQTFNIWSNYFQLQVIFTIAGIGGYYLWMRR